MASQQGPSKPALKTSLPTAYAAVNAEQPASQSWPTLEEQEKYLQGRGKANARHLDIALQHAHQIQAQKEAEGMILDRIIDLLEIPSSPSADPTAPSAEDAQTFKSAITPFCPGDFDNLIVERNCEGLCGYGLCPRKHRKGEGGKESFYFKKGPKGSGPGGRGRSMDIVPREKYEKWCSDECAERALFIRVQLAEQPVWERRAGDLENMKIELLDEARARRKLPVAESSASASRGELSVATGMEDLNVQGTERSQDLALERGDSSRPLHGARVDIQIKEKQRAAESTATAPRLRPDDAAGGSIEGYVPQGRQDKKSTDQDDDDEDLLDQI